MKVLFTGATGVLGRAAVPLLVDQGHEVSALARAEEDRSRLEGIGARPVAVDLFDPEQVETAVKDVETVIHFATAIPALDSMPKREAWVTNDRLRSEATRLLVDSALANGLDRFIQQSITFIYADGGDEWIDESAPIAPAREILDSALDAEHHVQRFRDGGGTGVTLRLSRLYGPGAASAELIAGVRAHTVPIVGDGSNFVSSLHVEDAAAALVAALNVADGTYNVSDDEPVTSAVDMDTLAELLGARRPRRVPAPIVERPGPPTISHRVTNTRFRQVTGWAPRFPSVRRGWAEVVDRLAGDG